MIMLLGSIFWHQDNDSVDHRHCAGDLDTQTPYKGETSMLCVLDIKDELLLTLSLIERLQLSAPNYSPVMWAMGSIRDPFLILLCCIQLIVAKSLYCPWAWLNLSLKYFSQIYPWVGGWICNLQNKFVWNEILCLWPRLQGISFLMTFIILFF